MNFVIYSDNGGQFHWSLDNKDGKPVAVSHAAFTSADAARRAAADGIAVLRRSYPGAPALKGAPGEHGQAIP